MIGLLLEALSFSENLQVPRDLLVLVRQQLIGDFTKFDQKNDVAMKRLKAVTLGQILSQSGQKPSIRKVASEMGVDPSTVSRWFPENDFHSQVELAVARKLIG